MKNKLWKRRIIGFLVSVVMVFGLFLECTKQVTAYNGEPLLSGYLATLYNSTNGLPTSEANEVVQSADGFIWIGGYGGLVRYDGNEFYRYEASSGINGVASLYVDSLKRLWVGTNDKGIALYEYGVFRFFGKQEGLLSETVKTMAEDGNGNIYVGTTQGLAYLDSELTVHLIEDERFGNTYINDMQNGCDGKVYGVTQDGYVFVLENGAVVELYDFNDSGYGAVSCIQPSVLENGKVYLGLERAVVVMDTLSEDWNNGTVIDLGTRMTVNCICETQNGGVWICGDGGIGYLDTDGQYQILDELPMDNSVDNVMMDYEGNYWFASSRQGVMKIAASSFVNHTDIPELDGVVVNTTCMYEDMLYIGTDSGLYILDGNHQLIQTTLTETLSGIRIRAIKKDSTGKLWICTYGENGLICYNGGDSWDSYNEEDGLTASKIRTVLELSDGTMAVAASGGVFLIKDGAVVQTYGTEEGIQNMEILCLCETTDHRLLIGSDGGGIYVLENDEIRHYGSEDGLQSEVILRIVNDPWKEGQWIITGNSIAYMDAEGIRTIRNFPYSNNFDMFFADDGTIWILSSNGVYSVNGEQLRQDVAGMDYELYDTKAGLPSNPTANARSYLDETGYLYICGAAGVAGININHPSSSAVNIKLAVPYINADQTRQYIRDDGKVTISADTSRLTIYGYALSYALHDEQVSYYLEGFDKEPFTIRKSEMAPISYTNLPGGRYVFHLYVTDEETGEITNEISVVIYKEKGILEQPLFWVVVAGLGLLLISGIALYVIHKRTVLYAKKQEENRAYINQMIKAFAKCIDIKDKYTKGHSFRVAKYASLIAKRLGQDEENVYNIALLHDVGKITIPDEILNKPGRLTQEEFEVIKQHAQNGYEILKEIEMVEDISLGAGYHHERIDGKGYPSGMSGEDIPYVAKIIAVADTFDAMNSDRPYRKTMPMNDIIEELKKVSGTQLEPEIVQVLLQLIEENAFEDI